MVSTQEAIMLGNRANNSAVQSKVAAELDWDPKLDSRDITVTAEGGTVALDGTTSRPP
jgi:osmotically-inducible protein OsmY